MVRLHRLFALIVGLAIQLPSIFSASIAQWPMLGHDPQHSGQSTTIGPQNFSNVQMASIGVSPIAQPVIDANGTIYLNNPGVWAFNSDGTLKPGWPFLPTPGGVVAGPPAVGPDGTVYAGFDRYLYAISPDGTPKWPAPFTTGGSIISAPVVDASGTIYLTSYDAFLYAINPAGTLKWKTWGFDQAASPALATDGTVVGSSGNGGLIALDPAGVVKWQTGGSFFYSTPLIAADGIIYTTSSSLDSSGPYSLLSFSPADGSLVHQASLSVAPDTGRGSLRLAMGIDGTIILATVSSHLVGYSPDLSTIRFDYITSPGLDYLVLPIVGADGTIYASASSSTLSVPPQVIALTSTGAFKSSSSLSEPYVFTPAALASDGTLYLAGSTSSSKLYRIFAASTTTGTIDVTTNAPGATFSITGPATFTGSGMNQSFPNAPPGFYKVTYGPRCRSDLPSPQTFQVSVGLTTPVNGIYLSPGFLQFPLHNKNNQPISQCGMQINAVFDHHQKHPYWTDSIVVAYTGETGQCAANQFQSLQCPVPVSKIQTNYGFRNAAGTNFIVNGHYAGGSGACQASICNPSGTPGALPPNTVLFYDGHPGYDYQAACGTPVYAAVDGIVTYPTQAQPLPGILNPPVLHVLALTPSTPTGYAILYLHLASYPNNIGAPPCEMPAVVPDNTTVSAGQLIGYSGKQGTNSPHLHFEVQHNGIPVDPYGWKGCATCPDPYFKVNVNLWQ